jgi:hypothetical protein
VWRDVDSLSFSVERLHSDTRLKETLVTPELFQVFGISRTLDQPFGGHRFYVLAVASLFGMLWMLGLWSELGYAYDRFGRLAWGLSGPVAILVSAAVAPSL